MINESSSTFEVLRAYLLARAPISEEEMDFIRRMPPCSGRSAAGLEHRSDEIHLLLGDRALASR